MAATTATSHPPPAPRRFASRRFLILLGALALIFLATYLLAWWSAYRLSQTFLQDADRSYAEGRYMDALQGYEEYDSAARKYVQFGGYAQVERIWAGKYAVPAPSDPQRAQARVDEIINERLTTADAEQFVQENIGRNNPYVGPVYLRLGELYAADGQLSDAEDVFVSIPDLFPNDAALIERAQADLERLRQQQPGG